jgi:hypothetical protein
LDRRAACAGSGGEQKESDLSYPAVAQYFFSTLPHGQLEARQASSHDKRDRCGNLYKTLSCTKYCSGVLGLLPLRRSSQWSRRWSVQGRDANWGTNRGAMGPHPSPWFGGAPRFTPTHPASRAPFLGRIEALGEGLRPPGLLAFRSWVLGQLTCVVEVVRCKKQCFVLSFPSFGMKVHTTLLPLAPLPLWHSI